MDTLLTILRPICRSGMNLSLKKCLMSILQAKIVAWSVNILKLASEFASSAGVASVVRRIERFLLRGLIKQHEAARSILDALPEKGRFILSMDGTSWQLGKFKYYLLAVGICFNGISLPICFSFLPGHDITSFVEEIKMSCAMHLNINHKRRKQKRFCFLLLYGTRSRGRTGTDCSIGV